MQIALGMSRKMGPQRGPNLWTNVGVIGANATFVEAGDGSFDITVTGNTFSGIRLNFAAGSFTSGDLIEVSFEWSGNNEARSVASSAGGGTLTPSANTAATGSAFGYLSATGGSQSIQFYTANGQIGDTFNIKVNSVCKMAMVL